MGIILGAAKTLIGERGNDAVSMREIAKHCGIAPSSIYQYYPDKNALLAAIMSEYYAQFRQLNETELDTVSDIATFSKAIDQGMDKFYRMFKDDALLATIWAAVQANTVLRKMDIQDSKDNAKLLTELLCKIIPELSRQEVYDTCFLFTHMIGSTVRLALSLGNKEGKRIIAALKITMIQRIENLATSGLEAS